MKTKMWYRSVLVASIVLTFTACKHNTLIDLSEHTVTDNCDPDTVYFQNEVLPIIISNCAMSGCHNGGGGEEEAHDLSDYNAIMNSGYVKPFNANDSKMIKAVTTGGGEDKMPPSPREPLSSEQIATLKTWINQGARNNECTGGCDTTNVTYAGTIAPVMNNYCTGCHGGTFPSAGIDLTLYSNVAAVAADGSLYGSVTHTPGYNPMPQGGNMLQDCILDEIRIWIENGYPNN
ncbi:MAG: hypothetical protein R2794_09500 [Chitinophagales bacterium]